MNSFNEQGDHKMYRYHCTQCGMTRISERVPSPIGWPSVVKCNCKPPKDIVGDEYRPFIAPDIALQAENWWHIGGKEDEAIGITDNSRENYLKWKREIILTGKHPRDAARDCGLSDYESITNKKFSGFSIRLSGDQRIYFKVIDTGKQVLVERYGDHYYS